MKQSTRLLLVFLALGAIAWWAPPTPWHVREVAANLGRRAGCPRPVPRVVKDSVTDLSAAGQCGVLWAALRAIPAERVGDIGWDRGDPSGVGVKRLSEVTTGGMFEHARPLSPPEPWTVATRLGHYWRVEFSTVGNHPRDHEVWVDQRSGAARRMPSSPKELFRAWARAEREESRDMNWMLGLACLIVGVWSHRRARATRAWRPVAGTLMNHGVTAADPLVREGMTGLDRYVDRYLDPPGNRMAADRLPKRWGAYSYRVGGEVFVGLAVTYGGAAHAPSTRLSPARRDHQVAGVPVTVYVDPADPTRTVLDRAARPGLGCLATLSILYGVLLLLIGASL